MTATQPIEQKVKAGAAAGAVTGAVLWALVSFVPSFRQGIPEPVAALIPFTLAWAGHVIAAWAAPHTPRPDLAVPHQTAAEERLTKPPEVTP